MKYPDTALEHALAYAGLGWRTAPIPAGQKYPGRNDWQAVATIDPTTITDWWNPASPELWRRGDDPTAYGACVVTGVTSGIFVLDIDPRHGGDETLADLEHEHGDLPDTVECLTGGGGRHLYFKMPAGHVITNDQSGRLGPGLDVRGEGGQVVAPPTIHPDSGRPYEWEAMGDPLGGVEPVDAPAWLIDLLTAEPEVVTPRRRERVGTSLSDRPGDRFEEETDWAEMLTGDGWTLHSVRNGRDGYYELWTRPGKLPRDGASASLYFKGGDVLKVFTPNAPGLAAEATYSRFGYYAATKHGGDHGAAARTLGQQYDAQRPASATSLPTGPPSATATPAEIDEWESLEPIPLGEKFERPDFPVDVFPEWVRHQVAQVADELQITPDLPAQLAITALSMAVAGRAHVQVNGPWTESLNTFTVTALPPGAGKSPAFRAMLAPLEEYEAELAEAAAETFNRVKLERDMIESSLDKAKRKGERAEALALQDELNEKPLPVIPRLMVDDVTPEKLGEMLAEQSGRIALVSSEGGLFDMMTGRYSDSSNLDLYLQAWSQDTVRVDRVSGRELVIRRPTLTVGLTVQPRVIRKLADRPELQGRGLTARFMYSVPADTVGRRDLSRTSTWNEAVASMYARQIVGLSVQVERDFVEADERSVMMRFTPDAREMFLAWRQDHERRLAPDGDLRFMAEWVTKLQSTTARLAGLLHLARCSNAYEPISGSTMAAAIRVGDYWEAHAKVVHDLWTVDDVMQKAVQLIEWVAEQGLSEFTTRDVQRGLRRSFEKVEQMTDPLNVLMDRGWVRPLFEGNVTVGQRGKPKVFAVNPHTKTLAQSGALATKLGGFTEFSTDQVDNESEQSGTPATQSDEVGTHARHVPRGSDGHYLSISLPTGMEYPSDIRDNGDNTPSATSAPDPSPEQATIPTIEPEPADLGLF